MTYDPQRVTPSQLVRAINSQTFYRASLPSASLRNVVLKIGGMKDRDAAVRVASVLNKLEGIEDGSLNFKKEEAQLEFDSKKLTVDQILAAVQGGTSFKASVQSFSAGEPAVESGGTPLREKTGWFRRLWRRIASFF